MRKFQGAKGQIVAKHAENGYNEFRYSNKKDRSVVVHQAARATKASLQRRSHISTEVNRTLCWEAQAVYFFFEKVYDSMMSETINPEKLIINVNA